jgi:hypothetical protein
MVLGELHPIFQSFVKTFAKSKVIRTHPLQEFEWEKIGSIANTCIFLQEKKKKQDNLKKFAVTINHDQELHPSQQQQE